MKIETKTGETVELNDEIFGVEFKEPLIHQVVVAYLSKARTGDKGQKTRSEVSGGGKKPWRQKGTGRARAGTIRSPIWVGGGRAFATRPGERNFEKKVNRKSYRSAMRSILSELLRQGRIVVCDDITPEKISTKLMVNKLKDLGVSAGVVVTELVDQKLFLSCQNLRNFDVLDVDSVDPVSLVQAGSVVITSDALKKLEQRLAS